MLPKCRWFLPVHACRRHSEPCKIQKLIIRAILFRPNCRYDSCRFIKWPALLKMPNISRQHDEHFNNPVELMVNYIPLQQHRICRMVHGSLRNQQWLYRNVHTDTAPDDDRWQKSGIRLRTHYARDNDRASSLMFLFYNDAASGPCDRYNSPRCTFWQYP